MSARLAGAVRTARLLSLPAGTAGYAVQGLARRLAGQDADAVRRDLRARNAARTRRVLGELKGGALKAAQLVSTLEGALPLDGSWSTALTALQEDAGALPLADVEPVLAAELGPDWRDLFGEFGDDAVAAASLGQVHRATWSDGRDVAVKVQYPGVREALATDLRTLSVASRAAALVARGLAVPPLLAEVRTRLTEELDYLHEAAAQRRFATSYDGSDEVLVPQVVHATPRVLVTEWLGGTPLAQVAASGTAQERQTAARGYQLFLVSGPERCGLLHTDPHPGNFRLLPDGRLGVLDLGSTLALPGGMPPSFGALLRALQGEDHDEVLRALRAAGLVRPGVRIEVDKLVDYLGPFSVPAAQEEFTFTRPWLRQELGRVNDPRSPDFAVALKLTLPAEHLFTHRVWLSMVGVLCSLEATVPVAPVLRRWLPGFAAEGPAAV